MIYKVELFKVEYPRGEPYKRTLLATTFLTDFSLNGATDDLGRVARDKTKAHDATHFSADGMQSVVERYWGIPLPWQPKPGKWEPVCAGTI